MSKMRKGFLPLLIAAVMVSAAACGSGSGESNESNGGMMSGAGVQRMRTSRPTRRRMNRTADKTTAGRNPRRRNCPVRSKLMVPARSIR